LAILALDALFLAIALDLRIAIQFANQRRFAFLNALSSAAGPISSTYWTIQHALFIQTKLLVLIAVAHINAARIAAIWALIVIRVDGLLAAGAYNGWTFALSCTLFRCSRIAGNLIPRTLTAIALIELRTGITIVTRVPIREGMRTALSFGTPIFRARIAVITLILWARNTHAICALIFQSAWIVIRTFCLGRFGVTAFRLQTGVERTRVAIVANNLSFPGANTVVAEITLGTGIAVVTDAIIDRRIHTALCGVAFTQRAAISIVANNILGIFRRTNTLVTYLTGRALVAVLAALGPKRESAFPFDTADLCTLLAQFFRHQTIRI